MAPLQKFFGGLAGLAIFTTGSPAVAEPRGLSAYVPWHVSAMSQPSRARHAPPTGAPMVLSGKILTPTFSVNTTQAKPTITFKFNAPGQYSYNNFIFTGPSGQTVFTGYGIAPPGPETRGTITYADAYNGFTIFSEPGTWTMTSGQIGDLDGNVTNYTQSQLASLFPSVTLNVMNTGTYDVTPPTVSGGKIVTPIVRLSSAAPFFEVQLSAADDVSGLSTTYIYLNEPDGTAYPGFAYLQQDTQQLSGTVTAGALLNTPGLPTGTWTITGYDVCDVAQNCITQTDPATLQKQFGTVNFVVKP